MTTPEEAAALAEKELAVEIRALAMELEKRMGSGESPFVKGIITAIANTASPPTISMNISGDTVTTISNVRMLNNYSPQVGHTVLVLKQGPDILVMGHIAEQSAFTVSNSAGGWVRATLAAGSHGGNSNGDVYYRRILDHGSWKMQWRGGWNVSGTTIVSGLATEYRPSSRRSVMAARSASGLNDVKLDFETNGSVLMVGANTGTQSASSTGDVVSNSGSTNSVDPVDNTTTVSSHSHGVVGSHSHSVNSHDHGFSGGSHSHSTSSPTWVSLNGVEYFL